ncbi:MAG: hypothetical protein ACLTTW_01430 [Coprobacter sp.]
MDTVKSILKGDKYIWGVYLMLCMISIVEMYSATSTLTFKIQDYLAPTIRHTLILFCGTIGVIIIHNFHYKWFKLIPVVLLPLSLFCSFCHVLRRRSEWSAALADNLRNPVTAIRIS